MTFAEDNDYGYTEKEEGKTVNEAVDNRVAALREVLEPKVSDAFEVGDVIRWKAAGRYNYAAIKTTAGWYTTSNNYMVAKIASFADLVEILNREETSDVLIASVWIPVR